VKASLLITSERIAPEGSKSNRLSAKTQSGSFPSSMRVEMILWIAFEKRGKQSSRLRRSWSDAVRDLNYFWSGSGLYARIRSTS
jgi:hypothetical protein